MTLSLKESNAISALVELLYRVLPWSGHAGWKGHVNFKTVSDRVGVGRFWQPGSKRPMMCALLEQTVEQRRDRFEPLIVEVLRAGIDYCRKENQPFTVEELDKLNGLILDLGFRFPDLWDPAFRASLETDPARKAAEQVERIRTEEAARGGTGSQRALELAQTKDAFFALYEEPDKQKAGYDLEKILNVLFRLHGLDPRTPFRLKGEQIDGSFDLDNELYLVEAKWEKEQLSGAPLYVFREKITGKSAFTRGVFIALNGITDEARQAITTGKQATFFVVNGYDLSMILSDSIRLNEFLRQRQRLLAEEGAVVVPFQDLWKGSRARGT
jgi:hypothetical protein